MLKNLVGLLAFFGAFITTLAQTVEDYKVTSLPGIDIDNLNFTQYAGHIELSKETSATMFFWMIEREVTTEPEKLIIWLNGGPGCSSMDGLFLENGPFRVNKNLSLSINPGGWQNYATNIYVDQPVGTGFSFASTDSYMHSMNETTDQFILFLDKLFEIFPDLLKHDLYIAGESYAGTYIPYFTAKILELNKKEHKYNIQGIAIGNGWISAEHQYNAYYDFSVANNLISSDRLPLVSTHLKTCQEEMKKKDLIHVSPCEKILSDVIDSSTHEGEDGEKKCINIYDIRLKEEPSPECGSTWPYELTEVTSYLRQSEVKKAIHAEKQTLGWKECTSLVHTELNGDQSKPSYDLLPGILEEIPILLFSGEFDLICNYIGTAYLIGNMTWNGSRGFSKSTKKEDWKINDKLVGYYTEERNLTYVLIKDGSHMVPYDRPIECLDMINRFMQVGNNKVKGQKSQVGDNVPLSEEEEEEEEEKEQETSHEIEGDKTENSTKSDEKEEQTMTEDEWNQYYSWGTTTLVFVILFTILICCCCFSRSKRPSASALDEFGGAPQREREGVKKQGIFENIKNFFKSKTSERKKFRLGDNDESNELDELVIETPTLFEAEEGDSDEEEISTNQYNRNQQENNSSNRFAIDDDETDDDFEDFADFDDGEPLTDTKKFKKKD